ncbi:MAG: hypothetical protein MI866_21560 [Bacteroidales bacterium]|nr:hypothetical protein [Bacteroidales bacterium]
MTKQIVWPEGKTFAFTVFDDTDYTTLKNGPELYQFLYEQELLTTKSVWPIKGDLEPLVGGSTCEDPEYLEWIYKLKEQGFEIALHNVTYHTSKRMQINEGLETFKKYFGAYPNIHANHVGCMDSIYWGDERLSGFNKLLYNLATRFRKSGKFKGTTHESNFFWGDLCQERIQYVRNFVYSDINTLKACPYMPYFDNRKPFVNNWFASSEGANCQSFCETISESNQDRLEEEGGCCIMYTHFGSNGFYENGHLNSEFKRLIKRISSKGGWYAPVSTILDYIQNQRGKYAISNKEHRELERRWLMNKLLYTRGTS